MAERRLPRVSLRRLRRGSSFVEVLLAMTIMALVLVGILQMFSVSLIINKGSAARTQMLFKCQEVVENIRWYYFVTGHSIPLLPTATGIPALGTATVDLPYLGTEPEWDFWGPNGANVMETPNGPYKIQYRIVNDPAQTLPGTPSGTPPPVNVWVVTVTAVPTDVPGATRYFGVSTTGSGKRVDYVAQFTQ